MSGAALTSWLLADFARGAPDVESDSAEDSDESGDVPAKQEGKGTDGKGKEGRDRGKQKGDKADSDGGWWPHFSTHMIRNRSSGGLARAAVAAQ